MPLVNELDSGLLTNAGNAGNVISRVAHQPLHINHASWFDTELSLHLFDTDALAFHGIEHGHTLGDKLHQIFIAGDDDHLSPLLFPTRDQSSNDVVGLVACQFQSRDAIGTNHVFNTG